MVEGQAILDFSDFLATPPGHYLLAWEQRVLDQAVGDIFGYHALQLGLPALDALRENRMPLRCLALDGSMALPCPGETPAAVRGAPLLHSQFDELPFAAQSIDLLVLPHVLEFAQEPHRVLREVDRVLVPEGQIIITGFNPASLWGVRHWMRHIGARPHLPHSSQLIALPRIKDWLKLLSFEVHRGRFGCYVPWARSAGWIERLSFLEKAGDRWWPVFGSVYMLTAIKRVRGMRLVGRVRRRIEERARALAPALPVAHAVAVPSTGPEAAVGVRFGRGGEAANDLRARAARG